MDTIIKKIDTEKMSSADFAEAARILRSGGLVAFPTETVYGLGGDATNPEASARIYAAKGRPSDNPLIVHIADVEDLWKICGMEAEEAAGSAEGREDRSVEERSSSDRDVPDDGSSDDDHATLDSCNDRVVLDTGSSEDRDVSNSGSKRHIMEMARALAERFWPGPLTMILPRGEMIPRQTTGGLDTVAVRFPSHPVAQELIRAAGIPIAAPSANLSGRPSTTKAEHVIEDLNGRVDMIIDGGSSEIGLESTIVDLTCDPALILRPGFISIEELREILPDIGYDKAIISRTFDPNIRPKAPGMKYRHYAPKGDLTIFEGKPEAVVKAINDALRSRKEEGHSVGVMASSEFAGSYECGNIKVLGSRSHEDEIASHLFDVLRQFDADGTEYIFGECFTDGSLGAAIMNRLIKAAGYHIEKV
ncbi:MAG: threonylcarbamoyl-AMP synthase [Lachnospiraceae bacterium]|nr:threonylcarbamoyl-AMP synthase [Lachnospiraceae bacterium]